MKIRNLIVRFPALLVLALLIAPWATAPAAAAPEPLYTINTFAYFCRNDDGSQAATTGAATFQNMIVRANEIYAQAGIQFQFDPATDWATIDNTVANHDWDVTVDPADYTDPLVEPPKGPGTAHDNERIRLARLHPNQLVVFFVWGEKWWFDPAVNHWTIVPRTHGASGSGSLFISMPHGAGSGVDLAHEQGHYFQNWHPFAKYKTVAGAAAAIKHRVESHGLAKSLGLRTFDGDYSWVTDTPPDAGIDIFKDAGLEHCGTVDHVDIPVTFSDNSTRDYVLQPDRGNILSYFKGCSAFEKTFSPQMIRRLRDGIDNGIRQNLVTMPLEELDVGILRKGAYTGGSLGTPAYQNVAVTRTDHRQIFTAYKTYDGYLKVVAWNVTAGGVPQRGGGYVAPEKVTSIAAVNMGLGQVATVVRDDASGLLTVIVFKVSEDGLTVSRKSTIVGDLIRPSVSAARMHLSHLATAAQDLGGNLKVTMWKVNADGTISRVADGAAGPIGVFSICGVSYNRVATAVKTATGALKVILWELTDDGLVRKGSAKAGAVSVVEATSLDRDLFTTAVKQGDGTLKVIAWKVTDSGQLVRKGSVSDVAVSYIAGTRLGRDALATVVKTAAGDLKVILWKVSSDGLTITKEDEADAGPVRWLSVARVGEGSVATAIGTGSNLFKLIVWELTRRWGTP